MKATLDAAKSFSKYKDELDSRLKAIKAKENLDDHYNEHSLKKVSKRDSNLSEDDNNDIIVDSRSRTAKTNKSSLPSIESHYRQYKDDDDQAASTRPRKKSKRILTKDIINDLEEGNSFNSQSMLYSNYTKFDQDEEYANFNMALFSRKSKSRSNKHDKLKSKIRTKNPDEDDDNF